MLKDINLSVKKSERIVICGPSGSGKSTMIRCINRLEEFQRGSLIVDGVEMIDDVKNIEAIRREVGMVFQHFNLFPHLTILENLTLGQVWVQKKAKADAEAVAMKYLERVKIPDQANKYPGQLSGGQQQRVAIARAFACKPKILFPDEPTGNLDQGTGAIISDLLFELNQQSQTTLVLVTHEQRLADRCDNCVVISDGKVSDRR